MPNVNAMFGEMAGHHPRDPHWYLPTVGIDRRFHREGLGSALLTKALGRCDKEQKLVRFFQALSGKFRDQTSAI